MSNTNEPYLMRVTDNLIGANGFKRMRDARMEGTALFNQIFASLLHNEMRKWSWAFIGKLIEEIEQFQGYSATGTALTEYVSYENNPAEYMKKIAVFHITAFIHWRLMTPGES